MSQDVPKNKHAPKEVSVTAVGKAIAYITIDDWPKGEAISPYNVKRYLDANSHLFNDASYDEDWEDWKVTSVNVLSYDEKENGNDKE